MTPSSRRARAESRAGPVPVKNPDVVSLWDMFVTPPLIQIRSCTRLFRSIHIAPGRVDLRVRSLGPRFTSVRISTCISLISNKYIHHYIYNTSSSPSYFQIARPLRPVLVPRRSITAAPFPTPDPSVRAYYPLPSTHLSFEFSAASVVCVTKRSILSKKCSTLDICAKTYLSQIIPSFVEFDNGDRAGRAEFGRQ